MIGFRSPNLLSVIGPPTLPRAHPLSSDLRDAIDQSLTREDGRPAARSQTLPGALCRVRMTDGPPPQPRVWCGEVVHGPGPLRTSSPPPSFLMRGPAPRRRSPEAAGRGLRRHPQPGCSGTAGFPLARKTIRGPGPRPTSMRTGTRENRVRSPVGSASDGLKNITSGFSLSSRHIAEYHTHMFAYVLSILVCVCIQR